MQNSDEQHYIPESTTETLKILSLHDYQQNAEVFRENTKSFRKIVHKWAEFHFITAPHKIIEDNQDEEQYGWFFNSDDQSYRGICRGGSATGFQDSVNLIEEVFEKEGPFDGVIGLSQGACFLGLLCDLQQRGLTKHTQFNFAIFFSGFKSQSWPHLKYYADSIDIPTMHVFGENDSIILPEMSEALALCFKDPVIVQHCYGHYVPALAAQKPQYRKFFNTQAWQKNIGNNKSKKTTQ